MIHQILTHRKGKLCYREVSCFCQDNSWNKGKMCSCQFPQKDVFLLNNSREKSTNQGDQTNKGSKKKNKLSVDIVYTSDSNEEDDFSVKDTTDDDEVDLQNLTEDPDDEVSMEQPDVNKIQHGTHVLVQFVGGIRKTTKYRYAAVCQGNVEEDGEVKITCLNVISGSCAKLFKINESDTSYVDFGQILGILPNPKIKLKGNRVFYEFERRVDVFEKS